MNLRIRNIGEAETSLAIEDGRMVELGPERKSDRVLDARGGAVVPGLIDSHTHLVFAGNRTDEFVMRSKGMSYLEIAKAGGGIRRTVEAVRKASLEELVELALPRLARMLENGVTTLEVKSGYGLTVEDEIKMLEAVRELKELQPIELVPTYLGAHTIPPEYADRREAYVDLVVSDELMGRVAEERLAEFVDVFCEESAFSVEESRRILEAGKDRGLAPRIHADQITQMGASRLAAEVGCVSADHLERIDEGGIAALREGGVIAGLLPGCSFYLGVAQAPARRILDAGVPVALATNYNPGSSMIESLPLVLSIACTQMKLTPAEALAKGPSIYDQPIRLGGLVQPNSVDWDAEALELRFTMIGEEAGGGPEVRVHARKAPPAMFREGMGVVVEGRMTHAGIFESTNLMVRHSNEYRAPEDGEHPADAYRTLMREE